MGPARKRADTKKIKGTARAAAHGGRTCEEALCWLLIGNCWARTGCRGRSCWGRCCAVTRRSGSGWMKSAKSMRAGIALPRAGGWRGCPTTGWRMICRGTSPRWRRATSWAAPCATRRPTGRRTPSRRCAGPTARRASKAWTRSWPWTPPSTARPSSYATPTLSPGPGSPRWTPEAASWSTTTRWSTRRSSAWRAAISWTNSCGGAASGSRCTGRTSSAISSASGPKPRARSAVRRITSAACPWSNTGTTPANRAISSRSWA